MDTDATGAVAKSAQPVKPLPPVKPLSPAQVVSVVLTFCPTDAQEAWRLGAWPAAWGLFALCAGREMMRLHHATYGWMLDVRAWGGLSLALGAAALWALTVCRCVRWRRRVAALLFLFAACQFTGSLLYGARTPVILVWGFECAEVLYLWTRLSALSQRGAGPRGSAGAETASGT